MAQNTWSSNFGWCPAKGPESDISRLGKHSDLLHLCTSRKCFFKNKHLTGYNATTVAR